MDVRERSRGVAAGITAAVLFGSSAPLCKLLLPGVSPQALAGLLYLGAGLGLFAVAPLVNRGRRAGVARATRLRREDWPLLLGITASGALVAPVLMLLGLERVSGATGALLLNLEAPFTIALAVTVFGDHLGRRETVACAVVLVGGFVLGVRGTDFAGEPLGALALAGACLLWGLDNNLTQRLSVRDPIAIVKVKALAAGTVNVAIAYARGQTFPSMTVVLLAMLVGLFSYGLSIVLDVYALRLLGAAREAAIFATAPFVGALASVPLLGDRLDARELAGGAAMALGVLLLVRSRHAHLHAHGPLDHEHLHVHDLHHRHEHPGLEVVTEPHSHPHRHAPLVHDHPHVADEHHQH